MDPRRPKNKRRLVYVKCSFCRRDKKKCQPSERQWPGEKCQRCKQKGFKCSAPAKKNAATSDALTMDNHSLVAGSEKDELHEQRAYCALAEKCMEQMQNGLKRSIHELYEKTFPDILTKPADILSLTISEELQYSCRFWISHLCRGKERFLVDEDLQDRVYNFLDGYITCWLKAVGLLMPINDIIASLKFLQDHILDIKGNQRLKDFVWYVKRFILEYRQRFDPSLMTAHAFNQPELWVVFLKTIDNTEFRIEGNTKSYGTWFTLTATIEVPKSVHKIAFSPDGTLLAIALSDMTVEIWDTVILLKLRVFSSGIGLIDGIAFSPSGRLLACFVRTYPKEHCMIELWDQATATTLPQPDLYKSNITAMTFLSDENLLATILDDGVIRVWDLDKKVSFHQIYGQFAEPIASSPDGRWLVSASYGGSVVLCDLYNLYKTRSIPGDFKRITNVAFSPDGKVLASVSDDREIKIWDPATGTKLHTLAGHISSIKSMAFSADAKSLVSVSRFGVIMLWDVTTGRGKSVDFGQAKATDVVALSSDGKMLARTDKRKGTPIKVWRVLALHNFPVPPSSALLRST